ncbi:LTA synthase family protein [Clostridium oryzae]|uniref:Lipoteichoic acid synthase 2 n=1 Tax=Clostridium oryzae TaxID=1450648 RepID=A0A1V4IRU4_9CLOT|nr:LTA synthase family protein [Clostridium oryzae]OPJ62748.1 lipoteichoic acid synthase 2 [Clostridium oryzae]
MKKIKQIALNNLDVLIFFVCVFAKLLGFGLQIQDKNIYALLFLLGPAASSILIFCGIGFLFNKRARTRFFYIVNIVISTLILVDSVYYGYFRDMFSIPVIQNGILLGPVKSSVASLFKWQYLLYYIDILIIPSIPYKLMLDKSIMFKRRLVSFAVVFLIGTGGNAFFIYDLNEQQPRLLTTMFNRIYIADMLGGINYHGLDVYNFFQRELQKHTKLSKDKEKAIKTFLNSNKSKGYTALKGKGKGKNLIVIQVEALQQFVIGNSINGQEITPNLNKWLKRSAYFDNYYYQVASGNTSDAEFMTNNSLFPAAEGAAAYLYCGNDLNSLPKALKKENYKAIALHGYREDFWNRSVMNKTEGYDIFYGQRSFKINETIGMGLSDRSFLNQSFNILKKTHQPYFSFLTTLTSHYPFNAISKYGDFNVGEYKGSLFGDYLKSIHYTDQQLGMFLDKLDKEGITDNSIIAIYGDHYAIPQNQQKNLYSFLNATQRNELTWAELQKVPLFIHFPKDENKGVRHTYGGEMDLYPTIANLYDLPTKYMMGKDIFNSKEQGVIFRNGSFTDGKIFYLAPSNKYYDIASGKQISETAELSEKKKEAEKKLEYSDTILNHNLLQKFNNDK